MGYEQYGRGRLNWFVDANDAFQIDVMIWLRFAGIFRVLLLGHFYFDALLYNCSMEKTCDDEAATLHT
jgi:hypothetical protein